MEETAAPNEICYAIGINTKMVTTPANFDAKAIELEDALLKWLEPSNVSTFVTNVDIDKSVMEYNITAVASILLVKIIFTLIACDTEEKVEIVKPKMRAAFMEASNNVYPTCAITKKCCS
jgi:hypothetical protein